MKRIDDNPLIRLKDDDSNQGWCQMQPRLKLYLGDENNGSPVEVSMKLDEFTKIIREAMKWDSTWLHDFADDEVQISSDLYEILSLYSSMRPSA